jgi:hypothetical protein
MGMDVFGISPVIKRGSSKPEWPGFTATEDEKETYFEATQQYEDDNPGVYFRANVWSWRPILDRIYQANDRFNLQIDKETLDLMGSNDGAGLDTQEDCNALADALETVLSSEGDILTWSSGWEEADTKNWYKTHKTHALEFVTFLRSCGGFSVC